MERVPTDPKAFAGWFEKHNLAVLERLGFDDCRHMPPHCAGGRQGTYFKELCKDGQAAVTVNIGSRYWIVNCRVPLEVAGALDVLNRGQIRTKGFASGTNPREKRPDGSYIWAEKDTDGKWYIDLYHIDTDEALEQFVDELRKNKLID